VTGYRVVVIEDDNGLRDVLARGLRGAGFEVSTAATGAVGIRLAAAEQIHAVVLDIGLPDADGRDVCAALRSRGMDAPVLFLTARGNLTDRLSGFSCGGDDYLAKPFAFPELIARLRALLRRSADPATAWGDLRLDPVTHALSCAAAQGMQVMLSPTEFRLLAKLLSAPDTVVRRGELISAAWPAGAIVSDNTLDQYVTKLRRKLAEARSAHGIEAARGVGYRLV
jgi:two-component system response regulator MprA